MAFLAYNPSLDPNKRDPNDPQNISGESSSFENQPPGSSSGVPKKSSGQYANIQAYLGANQGQAAQMGNQITQNVEDKSVQAQSDISKLAAEKPNTSAVDPNKYLANPDTANVQEYRSLKETGGYTGPDDITKTKNYQNAYGSATTADNLVKAAGTEEGRMTLLQDQYKRPNYSRGLQTLDQALLQNDPTSKQKFADINQKYSGIASLFNNTATDVGNAINASKQTALTNKQSIADSEAKAWQDLLNPISTRATQQNNENAGVISRVTEDAKDNVLNDETLQRLGLTAGQRIFDMNIGNYLTPDKTQVGINNAATAEERAKYLALQKLIGDPTRTEITADGKAVNPVVFDKETFDKDLAAKTAEYENAYKTAQILKAPDYSQFFTDPYTTPEQLENYWLAQYYSNPDANNHGTAWNPQFLQALRDSLAQWKAKYQPTRQIVKG